MRGTDVLIHEGCLADTAHIRLCSMRKGKYPLSPRMMTLSRAFRRGAAMAGERVSDQSGGGLSAVDVDNHLCTAHKYTPLSVIFSRARP